MHELCDRKTQAHCDMEELSVLQHALSIYLAEVKDAEVSKSLAPGYSHAPFTHFAHSSEETVAAPRRELRELVR